MSNNPIKPIQPSEKLQREFATTENPFTEGLRMDNAADNIEAAIADAGIKPNLEAQPAPSKPADLSDNPEVISKTAAEVVGRKLTRDEQIKFLNELPEDLLAEFAKRVSAHVQEDLNKETKARKSPKYVTDFTTMHEADIFDLNIPIQAIDHQPPEYMNVELKDSNFVPRWIHMSAMRLGLAKSQGWSYVVPEDLAKALNIEIEEDASGHMVMQDVVLMKNTKAKVYTQIRANFQRALSITHPDKLHARMRNAVESEIERSSDEYGVPLAEAYHKYKESGAISTYLPLAK